MRLWVQSLALLSVLRIQCCCELWCRLQTRLGSCVAVAVVKAGGYSSNWTPSLGTSICRGSDPRNGKKMKKKENDTIKILDENIGKTFFITLNHFFFFFFGFLGLHPRHVEVPRLGSNQSYSCQCTPQPQQHRIQAVSATYTTAHGNAGSSTH